MLQDDEGTFFSLLWSSKKQSCVSRSTTEAEIVSATTLVFDEGIPMKTLVEMLMSCSVGTLLHEDNQSDLLILKNGYSPKLRSLNRTHRISVAALSEILEDRLLQATLTPTKEQLADVFTKALSKSLFLELRARMGVRLPPKVMSNKPDWSKSTRRVNPALCAGDLGSVGGCCLQLFAFDLLLLGMPVLRETVS